MSVCKWMTTIFLDDSINNGGRFIFVQWNYYMTLKALFPRYVESVTYDRLTRYRLSGLRYMQKLRKESLRHWHAITTSYIDTGEARLIRVLLLETNTFDDFFFFYSSYYSLSLFFLPESVGFSGCAISWKDKWDQAIRGQVFRFETDQEK